MLIALLAGVLGAAGCRVRDERVLTVNVPEMAASLDQARVRRAIESLGGVKADKIAFDLEARKVVVVYDSMVIAHKNIEIAIAEAGYAANGIPAVKPRE